MTYQDIAGWSQIMAMAIFGTVLAGVLVYAFRPANKQRFEAASRIALVEDDTAEGYEFSLVRDDSEKGTPHGRA